MQPLIRRGRYSVLIQNREVGRMRAAADSEVWYFSRSWQSAADEVVLQRMGGIAQSASDWLDRTHNALRPFAKGEVCELRSGFSSRLMPNTDGLAFDTLEDSPDPTDEWMQLDPGVVTVWSKNHFGNQPDLGYGYIEVRANGTRVENWVAIDGASPAAAVRVERVWRGTDRTRAQEEFRRITAGVNLDLTGAQKSFPTVYTNYSKFQQAVSRL